jgi:hypothetical protein
MATLSRILYQFQQGKIMVKIEEINVFSNLTVSCPAPWLPDSGHSPRDPRTAATKASHKSSLGCRPAFPEEITIPGIQRTIEIAASRQTAGRGS